MSQHALSPTSLPRVEVHDPHLAHHFTDLSQQRESATLGMWLFLATEIMLFGAIFAAYMVYRYNYYEGFVEASRHLWVSLGTVNTIVLLASSFAMALAVHAAHEGDAKRIVRYLLLTIVLGTVFLGIKFTEYYLDAREGLIPLPTWWRHDVPNQPHVTRAAQLFFVFYFTMTMLHALHMTAGMTLLAALASSAHKHRYTKTWYTPIEMAGLYWHFVDIVWVFLFPTLYLVSPTHFWHGA